jgi:hypothetical protein
MLLRLVQLLDVVVFSSFPWPLARSLRNMSVTPDLYICTLVTDTMHALRSGHVRE